MILIQPQPHLFYQSTVTPGWTAEGRPAHVLVVKASYEYDLNGTVTALEQSDPLCDQDHYRDDDALSRAPESANDCVPFKAGSEILLHARAWCARPRPAFRVRAALHLDNGIEWEKPLAVIGPRVWKNTLFGVVPGEPEPLNDLPIRYEYAYGGCNPNDSDDAWPANPVGLGYPGRGRNKGKPNGAPLPQIENPGRLISKPGQRPEPQGYGPIPAHWSPRTTAFEGMNEDKAARGEYPYDGPLPGTAYHSAPRDQWFDRALEGPCTLSLTGLTEGLPEYQPLTLNWRIPRLPVTVTDASRRELTLAADTLVVETEPQRLHLLYRHAFDDVPERYWAEVRLGEPAEEHAQENNHA